MVKKCSKCGETKDIREFRLIRKQQRRSDYCKKCEGLDTKDYKAKTRKANIKKQIKKCWTELCEDMDSKELDLELYNFKKIWEQVQDNAK